FQSSFSNMRNSNKLLGCAAATFLSALSLSQGQTHALVSSASNVPSTGAQAPAPAEVPVRGNAAEGGTAAVRSNPAEAGTKGAENAPMTLVQAPGGAPPASPAPAAGANAPATTEQNSVIESGGVGVREFQGDDVGQVLRLLARQAKINLVVSEAVTGTVTMR